MKYSQQKNSCSLWLLVLVGVFGVAPSISIGDDRQKFDLRSTDAELVRRRGGGGQHYEANRTWSETGRKGNSSPRVSGSQLLQVRMSVSDFGQQVRRTANFPPVQCMLFACLLLCVLNRLQPEALGSKLHKVFLRQAIGPFKSSGTPITSDLEQGVGSNDAEDKEKQLLGRVSGLLEFHAKVMSEAHTLSVEDLGRILLNPNLHLAKLRTANTPVGLSEAEVIMRRGAFGPNRVTPPDRTCRWILLLGQVFGGVFNVMLWVCVGCEAVLALFLEGDDILTPAVLSLVIVSSGVLQWWTEQKAEGMMDALQHMQAASKVRTWRVEESCHVDVWVETFDLVPGDLIVLEAGERVPADVRIVDCSETTLVDNSALTGESVAEQRSSEKSPNDLAAMEARNIAFSGTSVIQGKMLCVVTATGDCTFLGQIAAKIGSARTRSSLELQIEHFVHIIAIVAVVVGILSLVANMLSPMKRSPAEILGNAATAFFAQVPEGLLPTVTVCLMISSKKMAARKVLVRRIDAVETLGCVSVLCSDKTGTLTSGCMTATDIVVADGGLVDRTVRQFALPLTPSEEATAAADMLTKLGRCAVLNVADTAYGGGPTELAIVAGCAQLCAVPVEEVRAARPTLYEIPFNSSSKWMLTVHDVSSSESRSCCLLVLKGAPERVLGFCGSETPDLLEAVEAKLTELMAQGKRVLCFADRELSTDECPELMEFRGSGPDDANFPLSGFRFRGLVALEDPPKPGVSTALGRIAKAGCRTIMVTGDHPTTAEAIARRIGLIEDGADLSVDCEARRFLVVTGASLENWMPEDDFGSGSAAHCHAISSKASEAQGVTEDTELDVFWRNCVRYTKVFARVSPMHKRAIVRALQRYGGHITAMTGDGVNDAPALKEAEVGVAMGIRGTEVAKEAADIVLLDDDLRSIVAGIEQGRLCSENLRKSIMYTLCSKLPQVLPTFAELLGMPLALSTVQVLLIDIGTDIWTAIAFAWQPVESELMERKPRHPRRDPMVDWSVLRYSYCYIGVLQALACWAAFILAAPRVLELQHNHIHRSAYVVTDSDAVYTGMTAYYWTLVLGQVGAAFAATTVKESAVFGNHHPNRWLLGCVAFELLLALTVIYWQPLEHNLKTRPLGTLQLCYGLLGFGAILALEELRKLWLRTRS